LRGMAIERTRVGLKNLRLVHVRPERENEGRVADEACNVIEAVGAQFLSVGDLTENVTDEKRGGSSKKGTQTLGSEP